MTDRVVKLARLALLLALATVIHTAEGLLPITFVWFRFGFANIIGFILTDYATVVSDVHYVRVQAKQELERLISLCRELKDPTLIYCRSPKRVRDVTSALIESKHWPKVT